MPLRHLRKTLETGVDQLILGTSDKSTELCTGYEESCDYPDYYSGD